MERDERSTRKAKTGSCRESESARARLEFPVPDEQLATFFADTDVVRQGAPYER
jgi:hypothetical protein